MSSTETTGTPYDDVFRTLLNDCGKLIIPLVNEAFGESYTGKENIVFLPNEHFLNRQNGGERERVTDTSFRIVGEETKGYHWECQSGTDSSMLVRFFEYDAQIALDGGRLRENILTVAFPHSAALFLRNRPSTPDRMSIRMSMPGGWASYEIPIIKAQRYGLEEIFQKKLLFLLPFYIFTHESRFAVYNEDKKALESLKREYAAIRVRLEKMAGQGEISEYTKCMLLDMSGKVAENLAAKYENVRKGVRDIMVGKVLEYEAKTIRREGIREGVCQGISQGISQGIKEGRLKTLAELVRDGLLSMEEASVRAALSPEEFQKKIKNL